MEKNKKIIVTSSRKRYPPAVPLVSNTVPKNGKNSKKRSRIESHTCSKGKSKISMKKRKLEKQSHLVEENSVGNEHEEHSVALEDSEGIKKWPVQPWKEEQKEIFKKYYEQGMKTPKSRVDLVELCATETGKTQKQVQSYIKNFNQRILKKKPKVAKSGYDMAVQELAEMKEYETVAELQKAASTLYSEEKLYYQQKFQNHIKTDDFKKLKLQKDYSSLIKTVRSAQDKLKENYGIQSLFAVIGAKTEDEQIVQSGIKLPCGSDGLLLYGTQPSFQDLQKEKGKMSAVIDCMAFIQEKHCSGKEENVFLKPGEERRAQLRAKYLVLIDTKWRADIGTDNYSKKYQVLKGAKNCKTEIVEVLGLPEKVSKVDSIAYMSDKEMELLLLNSRKWKFQKIKCSLSYAIEYKKMVDLMAIRDFSGRKSERDPLGYDGDEKGNIHRAETPLRKITSEQIEKAKQSEPESKWEYFMKKFEDMSGESQANVYSMQAASLAIKRPNKKEISQFLETYPFMRKLKVLEQIAVLYFMQGAIGSEASKQSWFWETLMPNVSSTPLETSVLWEACLRSRPEGEFNALYELELQLCDETNHIIRKQDLDENDSCLFCGDDCECPPFVKQEIDDNEKETFSVVIGGCKVISEENNVMTALNLCFLLYHSMLYQYTIKGKRCFLLEVLSRSYQFGCHHETVSKLDIARNFLNFPIH